MFRYLNQVPMCSGSEDTAKSAYAAFHTLDSIRLFICYVGNISGTNGEEINSVAICGGFTHLQLYMHWTINSDSALFILKYCIYTDILP